jgi:WD40 repeat protein
MLFIDPDKRASSEKWAEILSRNDLGTIKCPVPFNDDDKPDSYQNQSIYRDKNQTAQGFSYDFFTNDSKISIDPTQDALEQSCVQTNELILPSQVTEGSEYMAAGCENGRIVVWKRTQENPIRYEQFLNESIHARSINSLCILDGQNRLASASDDGKIKIWNLNDFQNRVQMLEIHSSPNHVKTLCYFSNLDCLISGSREGKFIVWKRNQDQNGMHFVLDLELSNAHLGDVNALVALPSNILASGSADCLIKTWKLLLNDAFSLTYIQTEEMRHNRSVTCLAASNNNRIISGSEDGQIKIWDYLNGLLLETLINGNCVFSLLWLNNELFASGSADSNIRIWSPFLERQFNQEEHYIFSMTKIDNDLLAAGSQNVKIWQMNILIQILEVIPPHYTTINSIVHYRN